MFITANHTDPNPFSPEYDPDLVHPVTKRESSTFEVHAHVSFLASFDTVDETPQNSQGEEPALRRKL